MHGVVDPQYRDAVIDKLGVPKSAPERAGSHGVGRLSQIGDERVRPVVIIFVPGTNEGQVACPKKLLH